METVFKRIGGFVIDTITITIVIIIINFIFFESTDKVFNESPVYLGYFLFLLKDLYSKNGSIGKKILKLKITTKNDKYFIVKKIARNITAILWPLEGISLFITKRRITDFLFSTDVIIEKKLP